MRMVVFGLSVSSSWGNGHATLWRGLIHALARMGHSVTFFERDTPYYAAHRDCHGLPNGKLVLYSDWQHVAQEAERAMAMADVAMVTSYCPDGRVATRALVESDAPLKVFYDLDTPMTLHGLARGDDLPYLLPSGLCDFDLVLSYTGGPALAALREQLGARRVAPLYGSVDPALHAPSAASERFRADLSYLGTYASERQHGVERLFLEPARQLAQRKFVLGGSQYPADFPWTSNIHYLAHVPPAEHASFYCSARLNLNVTRAPMAAMGYCPSGRLFEAGACGAAMISDAWQGLDHFYTPGREILIAHDAQDVVRALDMSDEELTRMGRHARERTLDEHTTEQRARELLELLQAAERPLSPPVHSLNVQSRPEV